MEVVAVEAEPEPEATSGEAAAVEVVVVEVEPWGPNILKPWMGPASFTISMARRRGHVLTGTSAP